MTLTESNAKTITEITERDVVGYLNRHPEFFQQHLELLASMHIPHPSGNAVSLISKQLEIFRVKHHELENQLLALIDIARENDSSFHRLHKLTLTLLKASTLEQVIQNLEIALAEFFLSDLIAIRFVQEELVDSALAHLFVSPGDRRLQYFEKELGEGKSFCGAPNALQAEFLFGARSEEVRSCAIIPMVYPRIKGLLAIGHTDALGFHADMGNIFLTQISEIAATRLLSLRPPLPLPLGAHPLLVTDTSP